MKQNQIKTKSYVLPPSKKVDREKLLLIIFTLVTSAMFAIALTSLIDTSNTKGIFRIFVLTTGASIISYSVNTFAIIKGAVLFARGFRIAGVVSVVSILIVGIALFMASFSGMVLSGVEKLKLQNYGIELSQYISLVNLKATEAARALPVIHATKAEFTSNAKCEISHSCISGRGNGGRGTISKILEVLAVRANNVANQLDIGETAKQNSLKLLNKLIEQYQDKLEAQNTNALNLRSDLQKIDAKINQEISTLNESIPTIFLRSYAEELEVGIIISDRPIVTQRLNSLLQKNGRSLTTVLNSVEENNHKRPTFPKKTGVGDTFFYLSEFAPIALICFSLDLLIPICLWLYTVFFLLWDNHLKRLQEEELARQNSERKATNIRGGK